MAEWLQDPLWSIPTHISAESNRWSRISNIVLETTERLNECGQKAYGGQVPLRPFTNWKGFENGFVGFEKNATQLTVLQFVLGVSEM